MINPTNHFIIATYGLKNTFGFEPVYLVVRESDGSILSHAFDLESASSELIKILKEAKKIPEELLQNQKNIKHISNALCLIVPAYANHIVKTNKIELKCYFLQDKQNTIIAFFLENFYQRIKLESDTLGIINKNDKENNLS